MPTTMPVNHQRQRMIRDHLKKQEEDAGGREKLPQEKLIGKSGAKRAPIYQLGLGDLAFNKANGRITAEVLEKEAELGRDLDSSNLEDQKIIREMLLTIRPDENAKILEDLIKNGQVRPGIITCDGIVINGNRRKALLEKLNDKKYKYLDVQVLPSDITKAELWLIEAGIQMSAPQQLDYSPINHLLKLREGTNSGLKPEDMAASMYGVTEEKINGDLRRLDSIDEYLGDFLKKPKRYYLVRQLNEHFIDLQEILTWASHPRGVRINWEPDESDRNELKLIAFYFIRIKFPHLRIRGLRDLFATRESWEQLKQALQLEDQLTEEERSEVGLVHREENDQETEETDRVDETSALSTATEEKDLQEEAVWKHKREAKLRSLYEDAKEQEQIVKDSVRPLALANRALKNIGAIPSDSEKLVEPELDEVLRQIIVCTNELRKIIQKPTSRKFRKHKQIKPSAALPKKRKRTSGKGRR